MSLFHGVHEVRLFTKTGTKAGYFESFDAALQAVENEAEYKSAYFTLNPLNVPASFERGRLVSARNTAGDEDVTRRVRLLLDFDPERPAGTNSTVGEKATALEQAEGCREWLREKGWPEPSFCDSGNGLHLLFGVDLPNDADSTDLVKRFLVGMKARFPLVDLVNYNASRLCKLYGVWSRKGEHSEERPHRRSAILEHGSGMVTIEQIRAASPGSTGIVVRNEEVKPSRLVGFLEHYGIEIRREKTIAGGLQIAIACPWIDEHSSENPSDTVASFIAGQGYGFKCQHAHCAERHWREFTREIERRNPGLPKFFGRLPVMTHRDVARAFVEQHDDFLTIYDDEGKTAVWLPGTRWRTDDPRDNNLRRAVGSYLDELFERYPAPEDKRDPRLRLKDHSFTSGVIGELRSLLPPVSIDSFDRDPTILPLPDGMVANVTKGTVRPMLREDCQSKRIDVFPVDAPPQRWIRFLDEVTRGDRELAAYLEWIAASALTGLSPQLLFFFYGSGRNGKGVFLRLLAKILRGTHYTAFIRPEEVEYKRGGEDKNKRLFGRLRGMRLAFTPETVSGNLDWTLLKMLTGGDSLTGARVYQDERSFAPSHTLILTTNDRPVLPPTAAFKGRLRFVPFLARFEGERIDHALEAALEREMPAILYRLMKLTPGVWSGDKPPASVLEETADLLDENDIVVRLSKRVWLRS